MSGVKRIRFFGVVLAHSIEVWRATDHDVGRTAPDLELGDLCVGSCVNEIIAHQLIRTLAAGEATLWGHDALADVSAVAAGQRARLDAALGHTALALRELSNERVH